MTDIDDEFMFVNLDKACKTFGKRAEEKTDRAVFTCIADHTNPEGTASISQSIIAEETGYARRTVSNSIHRLAEKNLLTIEKTFTDNTGTVRGIASNIYHINPKYLNHAKPAHRVIKPWCSACNKPCCANMDNARCLSHGLTRLHDVLMDVVVDILVAAAERNSK